MLMLLCEKYRKYIFERGLNFLICEEAERSGEMGVGAVASVYTELQACKTWHRGNRRAFSPGSRAMLI